MGKPTTVNFRLRVTRGDDIAIGPGKIDLLEAIDRTGSITAAAKALGMSYRRAWLLVDTMNRCFKSPVVDAESGGRRGGGTALTPVGADVVRRYRRIEHAGSDGDIFSHCFRLMGIGKLVGTRTWGGVVGIWPRHALVDGSETTQPEFSFWFADVGWGVENYGTDPEIEIDNAPQDAVAGHDRQLERALATAVAVAKKSGVLKPNVGPRPNLARKALPPRR